MTNLNTRIAEARGYAVITDQHGGAMMTTRDADGRLLLEALEPVPDWEHDLNLAIGLVEGWFMLKCTGPEGWMAMFVYPKTIAHAPTPTAAICEAWLAWHQAQTIDEP